MFTLDEKQYDETKMSDKGKVSYVNIQNISNRRNQLAMEQDNFNVLEQHYVAILKEELPEEIKVEEKEE